MDSGSGQGSVDDYQSLISMTDVEHLKRAWRQEKAAPEILQFEAALIQRIKEQIQLMEETVEDFVESGIDPLTVSLYQMDLDRTQFLLRSYLRIRLQKLKVKIHYTEHSHWRQELVHLTNTRLRAIKVKDALYEPMIEKYMFHVVDTPDIFNHLSKEEKWFAQRCSDDLKKHLDESILSKLPDNYQSVLKQSIISEETDMVRKPELDVFVVCKTKYELEPFQLDDMEDGPSLRPFEMEKDVLYFVRYKPIKKLVEAGKIDLF